MSRLELLSRPAPRADQHTVETTVVETESERQAILDALDDADCRSILEATSGGAMTAAEISDAVGLPKSTAYRKLDSLTELGLLEERIRIRHSGKHASEFSRRLQDIHLTITDEGEMEMHVVRLDRPDRFGSPFSSVN